MSSKTIYFVAGEASADNHGAALMRALRNAGVDLRFIGSRRTTNESVAVRAFKIGSTNPASSGLGSDQTLRLLSKTISRNLHEIEASKPNAVALNRLSRIQFATRPCVVRLCQGYGG